MTMAKKKEQNELSKYDVLMNDFGHMEMDEPYGDEAMAGVMSGLIEASNQQMKMAIELTKLIVENNPTKGAGEEQIFSIFKKASKVVGDNHTLKTMLKQLGMD